MEQSYALIGPHVVLVCFVSVLNRCLWAPAPSEQSVTKHYTDWVGLVRSLQTSPEGRALWYASEAI